MPGLVKHPIKKHNMFNMLDLFNFNQYGYLNLERAFGGYIVFSLNR
jgi:hypothetical protein